MQFSSSSSAEADSANKFHNAAYAKFCFKPKQTKDAAGAMVTDENKHVCNLCTEELGDRRVFSQRAKSGYANLMAHLIAAHNETNSDNNYVKQFTIAQKNKQSGPLDTFISPKYSSIFNWIEIIVEKFLPFNVCEDTLYRKNMKNKETSVETVMKYTKHLFNAVVKKIKDLFAQNLRYGVTFDGWDGSRGTHYCGLYAIFENEQVCLLAMSPLSDETNFTADNYVDFINETLSNRYDTTVEKMLFISADSIYFCVT